MRYIGIIILLVLCLTLLLLTGCIVNTIIPEIASENLENQENIEEPVIEEPVIEEPAEATGTANLQKWFGLGMMIHESYESGSAESDSRSVDILLANGFTELRVYIVSYQSTWNLLKSKAAVLRAINKGVNVIWGVSSNSFDDPTYVITAANWPTFRQAILDAAQWAQDNGVFEFQIGNEEELHNDDDTLTDAQLVINLKSVATEVQEIFTRGNISYSMSCNNSAWITAGKGDIDIMGLNVYRGSTVGTFDDTWKARISEPLDAFGVDSLYITEFGLSSINIENYSTDEAVQSAGVAEMIDYIKASGITRAIYFIWYFPLQFGVVKADGTYRLLWDSLLGSG